MFFFKKVYRNLKSDIECVKFEGTRFILRRLFPKIKTDSIFIYGNQKSGTSIIAASLARYGALSLTLDINNFTVEEQDNLHTGELKFYQFIEKHKFEFSSNIIKEPALTFIYDKVIYDFPHSRSIFIVRDPRDTIRSILNRVGRSGNKNILENFEELPLAWQRIIDNRWLGIESDHYIESLSARWNLAVDIYSKNSSRMLLIKYEDFLDDKILMIKSIANQLNIQQKNSISNFVDKQFQPRGDRTIKVREFFGFENLKIIENTCHKQMCELGYKPLLSC
ncbi:MAG: sulfotransferase [Anaerolineales bacterium]|jgi:hypothetical protein